MCHQHGGLRCLGVVVIPDPASPAPTALDGKSGPGLAVVSSPLQKVLGIISGQIVVSLVGPVSMEAIAGHPGR